MHGLGSAPLPLLRSSRGKMEKARLILNRYAPLEIGRDAAHTHSTSPRLWKGERVVFEPAATEPTDR